MMSVFSHTDNVIPEPSNCCKIEWFIPYETEDTFMARARYLVVRILNTKELGVPDRLISQPILQLIKYLKPYAVASI